MPNISPVAPQTETQRIIELLEKLLEAIEANTEKLNWIDGTLSNLTTAINDNTSDLGWLSCSLNALEPQTLKEKSEVPPPKQTT